MAYSLTMTTRYEVVAVAADGRSKLVGYTCRQSRMGLLTVARQVGADLVAFLGVTDADVATYVRDGAGRWNLMLGQKGVVRFSGRTQREVTR